MTCCCSFKTNICNVLFNEIKPLYPVNTTNGRKCRVLLKYYQHLCRNDPDFNNDDLPELTDVEDDDIDLTGRPKRDFRGLFSGNRRTSNVLSGAFDEPSVSLSVPVSSSTLVEPRVSFSTTNPVSFEVSDLSAFVRSGEKRRGAPVETVPAPLSKRLRGRPPKSSITSACLPPPPKRGRGRPPKEFNFTTSYIHDETSSVCLTPPQPTSSATPVKKRGRGRPRKIGS